MPTRSWQGIGEERARVSGQESSDLVGAVAMMRTRCCVGDGFGVDTEVSERVDGGVNRRASMLLGSKFIILPLLSQCKGVLIDEIIGIGRVSLGNATSLEQEGLFSCLH